MMTSRSKQRKQTMEAGGSRGSVSICNHLLPTGRPPVARQQFPDDNGWLHFTWAQLWESWDTKEKKHRELVYFALLCFLLHKVYLSVLTGSSVHLLIFLLLIFHAMWPNWKTFCGFRSTHKLQFGKFQLIGKWAEWKSRSRLRKKEQSYQGWWWWLWKLSWQRNRNYLAAATDNND